MIAHFKSRVLKGFVILAPIAIIFLVIKLIVGTVDGLLTPIIALIPFIDEVALLKIPGVGFIIALLFLYIFGEISAYTHGERIIKYLLKPLEKLFLYRNVKDALEQLFGRKKDAVGLTVGLLPDYPNDGYKVFCLITSEVYIDGILHFTVFVPTPPIITTGNLITAPAHKVTIPEVSDVDDDQLFFLMRVEECLVRHYITDGVKTPKYIRTAK